MTRLVCLYRFLVLAVLTGSTTSQFSSDTISFDIFLTNLNFTGNGSFDLRDNTTGPYSDMVIIVTEYLSPAGGELEGMVVSDEDGCVKINIAWKNGNQTILGEILSTLEKNGFGFWEQMWTVSLTGCSDEANILRFRFYITNMTWSENFRNQNSSEHQQIMMDVGSFFSDLGGNIRALEITQNYSCVKFSVEWDALNPMNIMNLTSSLKSNGIMLLNQKYNAQTQPCTDAGTTSQFSSDTISFDIFLTNLNFTGNGRFDLRDNTSGSYSDMVIIVTEYLSPAGGELEGMVVSDEDGCVKIRIAWKNGNQTILGEILSTLEKNGFGFWEQMWTVSLTGCSDDANILRFRFYITNMTWSENFRNQNSSEHQQIMMDVGSFFSDLGGNIRALEITQNYSCVKFSVEWDALNPMNIMNLTSSLKSNGIMLLNQKYNAQTQPCTDAVSYALKINMSMLIDLNWIEDIESKSELKNVVKRFDELKNATKSMVMGSFNVENPSLVKDVELMRESIYRSSVQVKPLTLLYAVLFLSEDVPNLDLEPGKNRLMMTGSSITNETFRVIDVHLGSDSASPMSMCGSSECYGICKELPSSEQYCSCNPGYMGRACDIFDCRPETNNVMCQNGGECVSKQQGSDFECRCQPGYSGPLCEVDLNSCPPVLARRPGLIGLCQSTCTGGDCDNGTLCCRHPCGGNVCVEVGYFQKMTALVELSFPFIAELNSTDSREFQLFKSHLENWINSFMQIAINFKLAKVVSLRSSDNQQMTRRKRAFGNTVIEVELQFTNYISVEAMNSVKEILLLNGYVDGDNNWTIFNITYGSKGNCPFLACAPGSFCVTNYGGTVQCACPESKTGQLCDINKRSDPCAIGLCINGGICHNMLDGKHFCECPEGFSGSICQNAANHCPRLQPLMTTTGERSCFRQPCPVGFQCNADPSDRWSACCFNDAFLCDLHVCQNGGQCVSSFNSGTVCNCSEGSTGLFCEETSNGNVALTACQRKQLFNNWVISILETGTPSFNITLEDMRVILQNNGYEYFPKNICDEQGNFNTMAEGVLVVNPSADRISICIDKYGNYDPECGAAVCDILSNNGSMEFCINGGTCLGGITKQLCDCSGTGYHGVRCELKGEDINETSCTLRRDIAYMAIGVLNGSVSLIPGLNDEISQAATRKILQVYNSNNIFVPYCDSDGQYEYKGCLYMVDDISKKNCYCALDDGDVSIGSTENPFEPPLNCLKDSCPAEWGEDCVQPDWWCLEKFQCQSGLQKCALYTGCTYDMCPWDPEVGCVAKGVVLPCDPHSCEDDPSRMCQPCGAHGTCYNVGVANKSAERGYQCVCKEGFSGPDCEINENICSLIPKGLCESNCIGDLNNGQLCQCDPGYGGIRCDTPARSLCERQKAIYDDALIILKSRVSLWKDFNVTNLRVVITSIIQESGGNGIPVLNCTEKGFYEKVQCMVLATNLDDKTCNCVDFNGRPISSNVKPYIGYDVCTAPSNTQESVLTACSASSYLDAGELPICLNGGTCIFEIYAGKYCSCPEGYYGQFCQYQGSISDSAQPQSLCDFFADIWNIANEIENGRAAWITSEIQRHLYLNLTLNFLQLTNNESYALKAECNDDGSFKPAACYYNIMTGEKGSCYCWNLKGLLVQGMPVESSDQCVDIKDDTCPKMKCMECEHGYRLDYTGCATCDCKNPCEDLTCDVGQRCVIVKDNDCGMDIMQTSCTRAVCRSADKSGTCPGYSYETFSKIGILEAVRSTNSCIVTCYDDTDCEGNQKCCGLCSNLCIDPEVANSCLDYQAQMMDQLEFINMARSELLPTGGITYPEMRMLERIADIRYMWNISCADNGHLFKPLQCQNVVDKSGVVGNIASCFCVDAWGTKIEGAKANPSDPASCDVKPFTCPFVEPGQNMDSSAICKKDFDCMGNTKCCGNQMYQVCKAPVDTSKLTTTLDQIMSTLCIDNSYMCQGGSKCVNSWMDQGIACECPNDRVGPFCEQLISNVKDIPQTPCERKSFAFKVYTDLLAQRNSSLNIRQLVDSVSNDDMQNNEIYFNNAVLYKCRDDGTFEPKQCIVNSFDMNGDSPTDCFCVYENGTEIVGTRTPVEDGNSVFCGENMACPSGNASHDDSGNLRECEGKDDCPMGYACSRSTYGRLSCCLTEEASEHVCKQPKDVGMVCSGAMGMQSGIFYYFDVVEGDCKNFTYNGCEGNNNRFSTIEKCRDQCIKDIHPGMCPASPVNVIVRAQCPDLCDQDDDCYDNYKCCSSTCGKRCIPVDSELICPAGFPRKSKNGGKCNSTNLCEMGYKCTMTGDCCPDFSVDQCLVPPATQNCQNFEDRYFYNAESKMCQKFKYGGCNPDFNNFETLEDCCTSCNGEGRCKTGRCPIVKPGTVSTREFECSADGDCPGQIICCSNGNGATCVVPDMDGKSDCLDRQFDAMRSRDLMKTDTNVCDITNIPICEKDGTWAIEQCQAILGICWCVSPQGNYVNGTITKGVPQCQAVTESMMMRADQALIDISQLKYSVCDNGKDFQCCSKALCTDTCWAHPEAVCRINPCGGCKAEYYSTDGRMLDCNEGLTLCEQEMQQTSTAIQEQKINIAIANGEDIEDMDYSEFRSHVDTRSRSLNTDYPARCQLPPETGPCKGFQRQWYFDPSTGECKMFIYGMCEGNDNNFDTPEECYASCSPGSNPCQNINCSVPSTHCELQFNGSCFVSEIDCNITGTCKAKEPAQYLVKDIFIPSCQATGGYNNKQCHGDYCWCVNSTGHYINGLTAEQASSLICTATGTSQNIADADTICPSGQQPNIACMKSCTNKVCPGQPEALCVADLCSTNCSTKFVDKDGQDVQCTGDICKVFTFNESSQCKATVPCPGVSVKACPESVCEIAIQQNCNKNPCAVCKVDQCTCQPYFVDITTNTKLMEPDCMFLSVGLCKLKTCNMLSGMEKANYRHIDAMNGNTSLPACDSNGIFQPKQCQGQMCQCVDQFGITTEANADGSCKEIDKIKICTLTFTFNADYNTFKIQNKLQQLVDKLVMKLLDAGVSPRLMKPPGTPYEGSIKIDIILESSADSYQVDLAQVLLQLESMFKAGEFDVNIDEKTVVLINMTEAIQTESQVSEVSTSHKTEHANGLTETDKIIIGVVCGCVGLLIIAIVAYCLCCRKRKQKEPLDNDSIETVRESKQTAYKNSFPVYNQVFEDDKSLKVRL